MLKSIRLPSYLGDNRLPLRLVNDLVQFYLELNRLGRGHFLALPEKDSGALPHFLARMAKPEHASYLYYFLRCNKGSGLVVGPKAKR